MDVGLTAEQDEFARSCRTFAQREIEPRWEQADLDAEFPRELLQVAATAGLLGVSLSEKNGGHGGGLIEEVILAEETARVNCNLSSALMLQGVLVPAVISEFGNADQVDRYVRPTLAGDRILALAVTEPQAGSDVAAVRTRAVPDGDGWRLSGEKCFITLGHEADALLVLAVVEPERGLDGMSMFIVDQPSPGLSTRKMDMLANRPIPTSQVFLDNVAVPADARLGAGFRELMMTFNKERVIVAARWVGHARHAFEWGLDYATTREQFGKRIGDFQSIAFGFADAANSLEAARLLVYRAAALWDERAPRREIASSSAHAKLAATRAVKEITEFALHVGGGWALVAGELPIAKMAIDSWVAPVAGGSWEIQRRIIARHLGLRPE